jgi:flagellar biosynthesis protein FlhB
VPIVEKKPLAQALYRDVDIGKPIPSEKYAAVAEVLAYVYQLKGKTIPTPGRR